jgi:hypothetical protein
MPTCRSSSRTCRRSRQKLVEDIVPARSRSPASSACSRPSCRARLDPRPADHPRGHRRGGRLHPLAQVIAEHVRARLARQLCAAIRRRDGGTCPHRALARLGAVLRRFAIVGQGEERSSPWRRRSCTSSSARARFLRGRSAHRARRRCCSPRPGSGPSCVHRRALPRPDAGDEPGGGPPAGAAQDGRIDLRRGCRAQQSCFSQRTALVGFSQDPHVNSCAMRPSRRSRRRSSRWT